VSYLVGYRSTPRLFPPLLASPLPLASSLAVLHLSRMRRNRSTRITSDAFAAPKVTLTAIQASTDAFPPLTSVVSAVIVVLELSEVSFRLQLVSQLACSRTIVSTVQKAKANKKGCERIAKRSAQLVQYNARLIPILDSRSNLGSFPRNPLVDTQRSNFG
jgi:hypothetical protein